MPTSMDVAMIMTDKFSVKRDNCGPYPVAVVEPIQSKAAGQCRRCEELALHRRRDDLWA